MQNAEIRNTLKENNILQWQLADKLGVSETTLVKKLRYELSKEEKQKIFDIISQMLNSQ